MKKVLSILLATAMIVSLSACASSAPAPATTAAPATQAAETTAAPAATAAPETTAAPADDFDPSKITLFWSSVLINHPVLRCCELGFKEACEELGYDYVITGPESQDSNDMCAMAEAACAAGATAGLLWAENDIGVNGVDTLVKDYDAIVGAPHMMWEDGTCPGLAFCRGCSPKLYGKEVADFIVERVGDKEGSIAITQATFNLNEDAAAAAFKEELEALQAQGKGTGLKLLDPAVEGGADIMESTNVNASIIQANPDLVAAFSTTGAGPVTWSNAARKCNKEPGDLVIVAMDYTADNLAEIDAGYCTAIVAQPLYAEAYEGVVLLDKILRGEDVEYFEFMDAPLVYAGGEGDHDPENYKGILDRVSDTFK